MIEYYTFGRMDVAGRSYTADLIVFPQRIDPSWWRREGQRLSLIDLKDVFREDLQALVVGTGFFGLMKVENDVLQAAAEKGIHLHIDKTAKAVELFNNLSAQKRTAGAFHLTC
jgi:hypothetical protein